MGGVGNQIWKIVFEETDGCLVGLGDEGCSRESRSIPQSRGSTEHGFILNKALSEHAARQQVQIWRETMLLYSDSDSKIDQAFTY